MKITVTENKGNTVYDFAEGMSTAEILLNFIYTRNGATDSTLIYLLKTLNATVTDVTTVCEQYDYEFIVACIRCGHLEAAKYIFDTLSVNPDYIAQNGSPLILFAIQQGFEPFRWILEQGACLFEEGDFRRNKKIPRVTAIFCAADHHIRTRNALFNMAFLVRHTLKNADTLLALTKIGIDSNQDYVYVSGMMETLKHELSRIGGKMPADLAKDFVRLLIRQKCLSSGEYAKVNGSLTYSDIRNFMYETVQGNSFGVYSAMWAAYPGSPRIQK